MKAALTPLLERFVHELLIAPTDLTEAYAKACTALNRPVPKALKQIAHEAANRPAVAAELARRRAARAERLEVKADDILAELLEMRQVDAADIAPWDEHGAKLRPSSELTKAQRLMVKRVTIRTHRWKTIDGTEHEETNAQLDMHDTIKIRELIGRHQGLWEGEGNPQGATYNVLVQQLKVQIANMSTDDLRKLADRIAAARLPREAPKAG